MKRYPALVQLIESGASPAELKAMAPEAARAGDMAALVGLAVYAGATIPEWVIDAMLEDEERGA